ncbi:MAG: NADH-quinone oxidoreductase subunit NuoH [Pirellulales bacterium]|nr:NADH-quinone oxidoreductase subunit NuoH [Pirellulales bacterium]
MTGAAYFVLLERKMAAWIQDRRGPNRVGIPLTKIRMGGLGQPLADGLKFIFKEEFIPKHVDKVLYILAPIIVLVAALSVFAVIPFGHVIPGDFLPEAWTEGLASWGVRSFDGETVIPLVVAPNFDVALLYVFAVSSIAVYAVILCGWASNNKYSFLGAMRSCAQLIAYELPLGVAILAIVLVTGSLRLESVIDHQADTGVWFIFAQPLGFAVFLVAAFAEAARLPFDLPEAEQELIGGYHTELSGITLLMFLVGEFVHMMTGSFLIAILFFGGWHFWGMSPPGEPIGWAEAILRIVVLGAKVCGVILFFMLVRWSWPRFRFDQLMTLAWKVVLPLGLANLAVVAVLTELQHEDVYGTQIAETLGAWQTPVMIAATWILTFAAYLIAVAVIPVHSDNRPVLKRQETDLDALAR